jgi:hypothetical protein
MVLNNDLHNGLVGSEQWIDQAGRLKSGRKCHMKTIVFAESLLWVLWCQEEKITYECNGDTRVMGHSRFSKARKKKWAGINCK